VKCEKTEH